MKKKKTLYRILIIISIAGILAGAIPTVHYLVDALRQKSRYEDLSQIVHGDTSPRPAPTAPTEADGDSTEPSAAPAEPAYTEVIHPVTGKAIQVLSGFAPLYEMNSDIVGWMSIPGTTLDYPVMQTPNDPNYYLTRNFDRENSSRGCLYVQENCDVFAPSDNLVIYGHRMRDGSMFGLLGNYTDRSYWEAHPDIYFDTLTRKQTYRIVAVFITESSVTSGFAYHQYVDLDSPEDFDKFITTCRQKAFYDTGVEVAPGDELITLSTCEYTTANGRLVVVAKRIS